jgi:hypothetical protein
VFASFVCPVRTQAHRTAPLTHSPHSAEGICSGGAAFGEWEWSWTLSNGSIFGRFHPLSDAYPALPDAASVVRCLRIQTTTIAITFLSSSLSGVGHSLHFAFAVTPSEDSHFPPRDLWMISTHTTPRDAEIWTITVAAHPRDIFSSHTSLGIAPFITMLSSQLQTAELA